ncbi:MAG: hypothetical protein ACLS7Z_08460 [Christensenellales bacterium]
MRLIAFGGDEDARALLAARRAGWETLHIEDAADVPTKCRLRRRSCCRGRGASGRSG